MAVGEGTVLGDVRYKLASRRIYDYWSDVVRLVVSALAVDLIDCGRRSVLLRMDARRRSPGTSFAARPPPLLPRTVALQPLVYQSSIDGRMVLSIRIIVGHIGT